jgi:hypothetical protein
MAQEGKVAAVEFTTIQQSVTSLSYFIAILFLLLSPNCSLALFKEASNTLLLGNDSA